MRAGGPVEVKMRGHVQVREKSRGQSKVHVGLRGCTPECTSLSYVRNNSRPRASERYYMRGIGGIYWDVVDTQKGCQTA